MHCLVGYVTFFFTFCLGKKIWSSGKSSFLLVRIQFRSCPKFFVPDILPRTCYLDAMQCPAMPSNAHQYPAMSSNAQQCPAMLSNQFSMENQLLGLKLVEFCHFHSLHNHNNTYKGVEIAKETSSATPIPKKHKNKTIFERTKIPLCIFWTLGILLV